MDSNNLLILGAGQYGFVVKETAEAMGCFGKIAFLDDVAPAAVGKLEDYRLFKADFSNAVVAIGNPQVRLFWLEKLQKAGFCVPVLVHPKAYISPSACIGVGSVVEPMAVVNAAVVVETGGLLCAGCVVNHNAHVLQACQIDCNAVVAANAVVPAGTKVLSGTVFEKK